MGTDSQLVTGVDFVPVRTRDLDGAVQFYGTTLGLECSAHVPDRGFAEFETGNLTLGVIEAAKMGMEHHVSDNASRCTSRTSSRHALSSKPPASRSRPTRSTRASATWRSSPTPTATR
jgi:hypothetical protein